jgi:DNA-binding NtrC family response regulator
LPPLRDRTEDIEPLVQHFLEELSQAYERPAPAPDADLMDWLRSYHWPGNVRQLRNCIESMFVLSDARKLTREDLPEMIRAKKRPDAMPRIEVPKDFTLEDVEKAVIYQTLERCRGNRTHSAKSLGISVRTLERWLKKWQYAEQ